MLCSKCGTEGISGKRFCAECGSPLSIRCSRCDSDNGPDAKFCGNCGSPLKTPGITSAPANPPVQASEVSGERRHLTILFCDLVGSTTIAAQLGPEEWRTTVTAYQRSVAETIARFGGEVARYVGDGVMAFFGYPVAHDNDAEHATRAGLAILDAIAKLNEQPQHARLSVRVGIDSGLVVVGAGAGKVIDAFGDAANIAARLQALADPDTVTISDTTQRLVSGLFTFENRGLQKLAGIARSVQLYRVIRPSAARGRFEAAAAAGGLTQFVGREEELHSLLSRWERVLGGAGQVVLLSGEAGIGKSRLVFELLARLKDAGVRAIECRSSPYHANSAFYPIIEHLESLLQFAREDSPVTKLEKLQYTLGLYRFPRADTAPLLAALLSLPHPAGYPALTLSPAKQKQKTQEMLVAWLLEEAERTPVCSLWEDLHWADPSTLEFLSLCLDQISSTRLLLLLTFRPDFTPPWRLRSPLTLLTLNRLGRQQVASMVEQLAGRKALPTDVTQRIVARTEGVPLFVEELTKSVLGAVSADPDGPHQPLTIPDTLQDSLMARLDRLGPVKEVLQIGATLGREFSYELIQALLPEAQETLQQGLDQAIAAELLYCRGFPPQAIYTFTHALVRDTAYESLLKSKRRHIHQQVAQVLEGRFSDAKAVSPELLAHHYTEAALFERAIPYWQEAGQKALQRSANVEAISHLMKGLELTQTLPVTPERQRLELDLQVTLGPALIAVKGYTAIEVERAYKSALALCQQGQDDPTLFSVLYGLWAFYLVRAELETSCDLGKQLLKLASAANDTISLIEAHWALGCSLFWMGDLTSAQEQLTRSLELYEPESHQDLTFRYGQDPEVSCLCYLAFILWQLGYPDQALMHSEKALVRARQTGHSYDEAFSLGLTSMFYQLRREVDKTHELAERARALSAEQGFPFWEAVGLLMRGWAHKDTPEEGLIAANQGLRMYRGLGSAVGRTWLLALVSETEHKAGHHSVSLETIEQALTAATEAGERCYEAELYRLRGEFRLAHSTLPNTQSALQESQSSENTTSRVLTPDSQIEAEADFRKALEIARGQHAKSWELRSAMSLTRLWQLQGRSAEARDLLSGVYDLFTQGFDTEDLRDAKALLESPTLDSQNGSWTS